jgi:hypothetical protein
MTKESLGTRAESTPSLMAFIKALDEGGYKGAFDAWEAMLKAAGVLGNSPAPEPNPEPEPVPEPAPPPAPEPRAWEWEVLADMLGEDPYPGIMLSEKDYASLHDIQSIQDLPGLGDAAHNAIHVYVSMIRKVKNGAKVYIEEPDGNLLHLKFTTKKPT